MEILLMVMRILMLIGCIMGILLGVALIYYGPDAKPTDSVFWWWNDKKKK